MPFIVCWPGKIKAGGTDNEHVISAVDIYPSLCAITGAKQIPGYAYSGEDMSEVLLGVASHKRSKDLMWDFGRNKYFNKPARTNQRSPHLAIRRGDWKLLVDSDGQHAELFDIKNDPHETTNLADKYSALVKDLSKTVIDWYFTKRVVRQSDK